MTAPKRSTLIAALKRRSRVRVKVLDDSTVVIDHLRSETENASDRTLAIVCATVVEDALRHGLTVCMKHLTPDDEIALFEQSGGTLSSFASKIDILYAMNLISNKSRRELHEIREIRNAFAHALPRLSFNDKEVADLCRSLDLPRYWDQDAPTTWEPSKLYTTTCHYYIGCFLNWKTGPGPTLSINGSFL